MDAKIRINSPMADWGKDKTERFAQSLLFCKLRWILVLKQGLLVLALQFMEIGVGFDFCDSGYNGIVQLAALTVITRASKVYAATVNQVAGLGAAGIVAGLVYGYGVYSLALYYTHAGDIGLSVTQVDHVLERNRTAFIGH